jgi:hypothetical protein
MIVPRYQFVSEASLETGKGCAARREIRAAAN